MQMKSLPYCGQVALITRLNDFNVETDPRSTAVETGGGDVAGQTSYSRRVCTVQRKIGKVARVVVGVTPSKTVANRNS
jgi:hypothetical protein